MARTARRQTPEGYKLFHILVQGVDGLNVFNEHRYKAYYMRELNARNGEDVRLYAFCVLENHAHMLFYAQSFEPLTTLMKRVNTSFAMYYNKCKFRGGVVFNGRFKLQCVTAANADACAEYIHANCLLENPQFTAKTYPYSSFKQYQSSRQELLALVAEPQQAAENTPTLENNNVKWIDIVKIVPRTYENFNVVFKELVARYRVEDTAQLLNDREAMGRFAVELKKRTGATNLFLANELNINREILRKAVAKAEKG